jgi:hypothetical protein
MATRKRPQPAQPVQPSLVTDEMQETVMKVILESGPNLPEIVSALEATFPAPKRGAEGRGVPTGLHVPALVYRRVKGMPLAEDTLWSLEQAYGEHSLPETQEQYHREARKYGAYTQIGLLADRMKELDRWRDMAETDLERYQGALDAICTAIRSVINGYCGRVAYHPEEEEERDAFIFGYRWEHPTWSYGQVAREYNREHKPPDKKELTQNAIGLICSRQAKAETERLIRMVWFTGATEAFTKAMELTWWEPKPPA